MGVKVLGCAHVCKEASQQLGVPCRIPAGKVGTGDCSGRRNVSLGSTGHSSPRYCSFILLPNPRVTRWGIWYKLEFFWGQRWFPSDRSLVGEGGEQNSCWISHLIHLTSQSQWNLKFEAKELALCLFIVDRQWPLRRLQAHEGNTTTH